MWGFYVRVYFQMFSLSELLISRSWRVRRVFWSSNITPLQPSGSLFRRLARYSHGTTNSIDDHFAFLDNSLSIAKLHRFPPRDSSLASMPPKKIPKNPQKVITSLCIFRGCLCAEFPIETQLMFSLMFFSPSNRALTKFSITKEICSKLRWKNWFLKINFLSAKLPNRLLQTLTFS